MPKYNSIKNIKQHKFQSDAQKNAFKVWNQKIDKNQIVLQCGFKIFFAISRIYRAVVNFYNKPKNKNKKFFYSYRGVFENFVSKEFLNILPQDKELYYRASEIGIHTIKKEEKKRLKEIKHNLTMSFRHFKRGIEWLVKHKKIKIEWDEDEKDYIWHPWDKLHWEEFNKRRERVLKNGRKIKFQIFKCWKKIQKTLFPFIKEKLHSEEILNNIKANSPPDEIEIFDWSKVEDQKD